MARLRMRAQVPRVLLGRPSPLPGVLTRESTFRVTFGSPRDLARGFAHWRCSVIINRTRDRGPTDSFMKTFLILTKHPLSSGPSESLWPTMQPSRCLSPSCPKCSVMELSLSRGFKDLLRSQHLSLGGLYFLVVDCVPFCPHGLEAEQQPQLWCWLSKAREKAVSQNAPGSVTQRGLRGPAAGQEAGGETF